MASGSDIAVETATSAREELTQEAIVKVLWAAVDSLRDLVGNVRQLRQDSFDRFDHLEFLLSRAQENASIPRATPVPASAPVVSVIPAIPIVPASVPTIPTVPKVSTASATAASVSVPRVPAPAFASAPASVSAKRKVSIRPVMSVNPLKAVRRRLSTWA
jgi:hypothetical protein